MCSCHDWPAPVREAIRVTEREENTREDWEDLHDVIEQYRRRRAAAACARARRQSSDRREAINEGDNH